MMKISIIIPVYNEALTFKRLGDFLVEYAEDDARVEEVIVVDGMSEDNTLEIVESYPFHVIQSKDRSRARQMNLGAMQAKADILYFVHADVIPPVTFIEDIFKAIERGFDFGCFSYQFDSSSSLLGINAKFTRRDSKFIGGGDQTLFIRREVFEELKGFNQEHRIMEDYELYWRAKKSFRSKIITNNALVSSRKYKNNSYLRVQLTNLIVFTAYHWGVSQDRLARWYGKLLR